MVIKDYQDAETGQCMTLSTIYGLYHDDYRTNFTSTTDDGNDYINDVSLTVTGYSGGAPGSVEITKCANKKLSGQFEFELFLPGRVSVKVTDGVLNDIDFVYAL